jgi:hypothetical protein
MDMSGEKEVNPSEAEMNKRPLDESELKAVSGGYEYRIPCPKCRSYNVKYSDNGSELYLKCNDCGYYGLIAVVGFFE